MPANAKRAVIVGASSGIGAALARELAADGYEVGLAARRLDRLESLGEALPTKAYVARIDVSEPDEAMGRLRRLFGAMGEVELVVLAAGVGETNWDLDWEVERRTIDVNVRGFAAAANVALDHFEARDGGHLVGISSVAGLFGNAAVPGYSASKAWVSNYLDGLRYRAGSRDADIAVTDVRPGYVDTEMATGGSRFWEVSAKTAARAIRRAIEREARRAYVPRRWRLAAWVLKALPDAAFRRMFS
ncbi:SDR family NAD(P)-dependent oxidoreductase [Halorussus amylolyticus]|uniref:SDR family NAD(P)-dependent oxidoreductase n=1 Tax=Halorussus amylolyticus TaxID=1126242 RepID=UPI0010528767|nr:SDR family NAD(P)-dependent oxidoreductase [Halorussus amylolyticus]